MEALVHLLVEGDQIIGGCRQILVMLSGINMVHYRRTFTVLRSLIACHLAGVIISVLSEGFGLLDSTFQLGFPPSLCALNFFHSLIANSRHRSTPEPSIL